MTDELTDAQSHQVDVMHSAAYNAMIEVLSPLGIYPVWDMEWIGEVCDSIADTASRFLQVPEAFIYPYIGAQDKDVDGNADFTTIHFWDCSCEKGYIHSKSLLHCPKCGDTQDDSPDSRVTEVIKWLAAGGE